MFNTSMSTALGALALAGAVGFGASAAQAGGLPEDDGSLKDTGYAAPAPAPSWAGFYLGVHAGYADGEWDGDLITRDKKSDPWKPAYDEGNGFSTDGDGWLGGGQIGYNWQRGRIVLGVEGDISWTDVDGESGPYGPENKFNKTFDAELDYFGTARARVGYDVNGVMPYVTGGFAWGKSEISQEVFYSEDGEGLSDPDGYVSGRGSGDATHTGWTLGAGIEAMLGGGFTAKAEYLHVDLGEESYTIKGDWFNDDGSFRSRNWGQDGIDGVDLTFDVFRVGVNYKFGGREEPVDSLK